MARRTAVAAADPPSRRPRTTKATTQSVQADVEGVVPAEDDPRKVEFMGEQFLMSESIGLMPLLKFAHASSQGLDSTDMEGLAALYEMLADCLDQEVPMERRKNTATGKMEMMPAGLSEWQRFTKHATATKAQADDLMGLVQRVIERLAARPSPPPGDSSAGRLKTSRNLKAISSDPATQYPGLAGTEGEWISAD